MTTHSMFNPPHPGLTLRDDVLPALSLGVSEAAAALGVSRVAFSRVINGKAAISTDLALRIEQWLGIDNGGSAQVWLGEQMLYDLWQARAAQQWVQVHKLPLGSYAVHTLKHPARRSLNKRPSRAVAGAAA